MDAAAAWAFLLEEPRSPKLVAGASSPWARGWSGDCHTGEVWQAQEPPLKVSPHGPASARQVAAVAAAAGWSTDGWTPRRPIPWQPNTADAQCEPAVQHIYPPQQKIDATGWLRKYSREHKRPYWVRIDTQESTWHDPHDPRGNERSVATTENPWWWPEMLLRQSVEQQIMRQPAPLEQPVSSWLTSWGEERPRTPTLPSATSIISVQQLAAGTTERPMPAPFIINETSRQAAMAAAQSPLKMLSASLRRVELPEPETEPERDCEPRTPSVQFAVLSRCVRLKPATTDTSDTEVAACVITTSMGPVNLTVPVKGGKMKDGSRISAKEIYSSGLREIVGSGAPASPTADIQEHVAGTAVRSTASSVQSAGAAMTTLGPIVELTPVGCTFSSPVRVEFSLASILHQVSGVNGDAVLCVFRTDSPDDGWELLREHEQVTVTEDGTLCAELYSFARYVTVLCTTGMQVANHAALMISAAFSAAQQALKAGSKVSMGGWEGIIDKPGHFGYLVHGVAALTLASHGQGTTRSISVAENSPLTKDVANGIALQLCRASPQQLEDELMRLETRECRKRARAVGITENHITHESDKTVLTQRVVSKCWHRVGEPAKSLGLEGTAEEEKAAAKLQAIQRGKQARKDVEGLKIERSLGLSGSEEEAAAIARLQAVQRGKQARKDVKGMKAQPPASGNQ